VLDLKIAIFPHHPSGGGHHYRETGLRGEAIRTKLHKR